MVKADTKISASNKSDFKKVIVKEKCNNENNYLFTPPPHFTVINQIIL